MSIDKKDDKPQTDEEFIQSLYDELSEEELDPNAPDTKAELELPGSELDQKILAAAYKAVAVKPHLISNIEQPSVKETEQPSVNKTQRQPDEKARRKTPKWFYVVAKAASVVLVVTLVIDQMDYPFVPPSKMDPIVIFEPEFEDVNKVDVSTANNNTDNASKDNSTDNYVTEAAPVLAKAFQKESRQGMPKGEHIVSKASFDDDYSTATEMFDSPKQLNRAALLKNRRLERRLLENSLSAKKLTARKNLKNSLIAHKKQIQQQKSSTSQLSLQAEVDLIITPSVVHILSKNKAVIYLTLDQYSQYKAQDNKSPIVWILLEENDTSYLIQFIFTNNKIKNYRLDKKIYQILKDESAEEGQGIKPRFLDKINLLSSPE